MLLFIQLGRWPFQGRHSKVFANYLGHWNKIPRKLELQVRAWHVIPVKLDWMPIIFLYLLQLLPRITGNSPESSTKRQDLTLGRSALDATSTRAYRFSVSTTVCPKMVTAMITCWRVDIWCWCIGGFIARVGASEKGLVMVGGAWSHFWTILRCLQRKRHALTSWPSPNLISD